MLNDTPKCRSGEARECGSVPRLRVPRMRERKARKVESEKSGKLGIWKCVVLNDTPKCRNGLSKMDLV
ncbi:MAG: hypothetical protein WC721_14870 [Victivallaceae bacterium]